MSGALAAETAAVDRLRNDRREMFCVVGFFGIRCFLLIATVCSLVFVRQCERNQFGRFCPTATGDNDVLFSIGHIRHR